MMGFPGPSLLGTWETANLNLTLSIENPTPILAAVLHPRTTGAARHRCSFRSSVSLPPALCRHMVLHGIALGLGRRQSLLRPLRISDHVHPAGITPQAALLPQLLRPSRPAHLAGLRVGARRLLSQRTMVHRPHGVGCDQDSALVGIRSVHPEPVSSRTAARHRPDLVAGN